MNLRGARPCFSYIPAGHVDPVVTLSYEEVLDRSLRLATALTSHEVRRGDRVAFFAQPSPDYLTLFLGAMLAGIVPTPINHNFKQAETSAYLEYIDPRLVIYDRTTQGVIDAVMTERRISCRALQIDPLLGEPGPDAELLRWSDWDRAEPYRPRPKDVAMILHTSGTTALPKGVERTHAAVCSFFDGWLGNGFSWLERDIMLSWHPMYHQSGTLTSVMAMIAVGGHTIQWQRFSASTFWEVARRNRPTVAQFVPPAATYLLLQPPSPSDRDHTFEYAVIGGRTDHWSAFVERFGINAHSPYGSTETSYVTTTGGRGAAPVPPSELLGAVPHFYAGPVIPDFLELRVMGPHGPVGAREPGEIQVRGPAVFERYFRSPERTAEVFDGDWFKTGDIGYLREDGYLFMIDRAKQVIRRSSENISPLEIEITLGQHPGVQECAAVGVPDPIRGQEILACIIAEEGHDLNVQALFDYCAKHLSAFKVPRYIEVWDSFPRTGTEKVRKEALQNGGAAITRHDRLAMVP